MIKRAAIVLSLSALLVGCSESQAIEKAESQVVTYENGAEVISDTVEKGISLYESIVESQSEGAELRDDFGELIKDYIGDAKKVQEICFEDDSFSSLSVDAVELTNSSISLYGDVTGLTDTSQAMSDFQSSLDAIKSVLSDM